MRAKRKMLDESVSRIVNRARGADHDDDMKSLISKPVDTLSENKAAEINSIAMKDGAFDSEMMRSMRYQANLEDLMIGQKYRYCQLHGFISSTDPLARTPTCSICGSKMFWKKYLG